MTSWVNDEMQATNMPDVRLKKRLTKILTSLSKNAEKSIPASCQGWGETKSVYRFFDNHRVSLDEILSGHKAATIERISKQPMVLLAQDTTFMVLGTEESTELGTLKYHRSDNYLLHPTVAFTLTRSNLGVIRG